MELNGPFPQHGNKIETPPIDFIGMDNMRLPRLNTTFTILDLFDINEGDSTFDLQFMLLIRWFDKDLKFEFLKVKALDNTLDEKLYRKFWTPKIEFENIRSEIIARSTFVFVERSGPALLEGDEDGNNIFGVKEIYDGKENSLNLVIKKRIKFSCSFRNIKRYPFGSQTCSIRYFIVGAANNLSNLVPLQLVDKGPRDFGQYIIESWTTRTDFDGETNEHKVVVEMILMRKLGSIVMVTYLPTILMNLINQATNYITGDTKYDMIYTINITCMMVLASIYLSVSTSLPTTADIKPVEVWLLFNLAYPFLIILVNVILQVELYTQTKHSF